MHPEIYKQPKEQQKARNLQAPHRKLEAKKKKATAYNNVFHYIICIPPSCITTYEKLKTFFKHCAFKSWQWHFLVGGVAPTCPLFRQRNAHNQQRRFSDHDDWKVQGLIEPLDPSLIYLSINSNNWKWKTTLNCRHLEY